MKTFAFVAALIGSTIAAPQAVTAAVSPPGETTPAGCQTSYNGAFQVTVAGVKKRDDSTPLEVTLTNGVLKDAQGRVGYIASNQQFQFDGPVQSGALYTSGWSVCANNSIALGNSAIFYQCLSGTFYNLYDENTAAQCNAVYLYALGGSQITAANNAAATATGAKTVVCQIGDGQIQQNTCITTVVQPTPTGNIISQISDGQIQASASATVVSQITDGQIQAAATTSSSPKTNTITGTITGTITQTSNSTVTQTSKTAAAATTTPASSATVSASTGGAAAPAAVDGKAGLIGLVAAIAALAFLL